MAKQKAAVTRNNQRTKNESYGKERRGSVAHFKDRLSSLGALQRKQKILPPTPPPLPAPPQLVWSCFFASSASSFLSSSPPVPFGAVASRPSGVESLKAICRRSRPPTPQPPTLISKGEGGRADGGATR